MILALLVALQLILMMHPELFSTVFSPEKASCVLTEKVQIVILIYK